ncbi:MAG: rod shape-determining protein RodA [Candidatus Omnitrophica bacterium]|nr:rod shape-determining protein RodA [Candidatus Omnitrophota bacterium]
MLNHSRLKKFDFILFLTTVLIFCLGLTFLYSATYQHSYRHSGILSQNFLIRQLVWFIFGLLIGIIILKVDYQKWLELAYPVYGLNLIVLLLVLTIGQTKFGAQRWIAFGNIVFQPSEFSKLVIILTLARYLSQKKTSLTLNSSWAGGSRDIKVLATSFLLVCLPFVLIVKQPDLGTALTLIPILFAVLYIWGSPLRTLFLIFGTALLASPFLWQMLKTYQKRRILVFLNPNIDPLGAGYTIIQSKIAIGSGGFFGKGWLAGTQNQLNFLPERHTDFIFSVVGEEWGFLGAILLLILYFILIWRAFSIAQRAKNVPARLLACGIIVLLTFQIGVNISMTMGLVPVVGLPLPLISYGGSSLISTMVSIALLLNIGIRS